MTASRPSFSIILSIGGALTLTASINATVNSLQAQSSQDWELLLLSSGPAANRYAATLAEPRIRVVSMSASASEAERRNAALAEALGEFVLCLDAGDTLTSRALRRLRDAAQALPGTDCVYADEDIPDVANTARRVQVRKPDWSPERLAHGDYVGRPCALRTSAVREMCGFAAEAGAALDYDMILRLSEDSGAPVHIAEVLCHRHVPPLVSVDTDADARWVAQSHFDRIGATATVAPGPVAGSHLVRRPLRPEVKVSIIMPTGWQLGTVWGERRCFPIVAVRRALAMTSHPEVEVIVVYDEPVPEGAMEQLLEAGDGKVVAVPYRDEFNFSEKCNLGFLHARGDVIVLLNDDLEPIDDRWLEALVAPLDEGDVGMSGAKLFYEDGTIQHAGHKHARAMHAPARSPRIDAVRAMRLVS